MRARGGLVFDVTWRNGQVTAARVVADRTGSHRIALLNKEILVDLTAGQSLELVG